MSVRWLGRILGLVAVCAVPCRAQDAAPATDPIVHGVASNLTRIETWRFFEPPSAEVEPDYTFFGNRSDLDIRVDAGRFDLTGGFSYVRVERLPRAAIGPGGLGTGAFYFAASGLPYSYQVFLTSLTAGVHSEDGRRMLAVGRMPYTSGAEGERATPVRSSLSTVRRLAIDGRLVGTFDWSFYQRRFDGVRADWLGPRRYAGVGAFLVTQGGYEESANLTMNRLQVGTAYAGRRHDGARGQHGTAEGESQIFGVLYRDRRAVSIRPDNVGVPVGAADITVGAVGASHVAVRPLVAGRLDYALWGAGQFGDWYGQAHRAYAVVAQGGYAWRGVPVRPWLRAGASYASGDSDRRDDRHETFFPMLQDTRTFAQSMVYAHANLRDVFVQLHVEPHERARLRVDLHRLDLAKTADRWYQGSGATAATGAFFGYSSRPASGARGLGTVAEGAASVTLSRYWSVNGYAGRMWGGPVVRVSFTGDRLFYWYVENVIRLELGS